MVLFEKARFCYCYSLDQLAVGTIQKKKAEKSSYRIQRASFVNFTKCLKSCFEIANMIIAQIAVTKWTNYLLLKEKKKD